jgi:hypothetical protein
MNFKLDIKSIAILILLGVCILFFSMWFFKGDDIKDKINKLESENKKIELTRDSLERANVALQIDFNKKEKDIEERDIMINKIELDFAKTKKDLAIANNKVTQSQKDLLETKKKIEDLRNNPIKRNDDSLIKSLKEKLK